MPGLRVATASGNWSNSATWEGSLTPAAGDVVAANGFTVTIDQNINVARITTTSQTNPGATVTMTSNTTPAGYVVAASSTNSPYPAWRAFDNNASTAWESLTFVSVTPQWISYQFSSSIVIDRYSIAAGTSAGTNFRDWLFQGSNDNVNWTTLDTVAGVTWGTQYNSSLLGNSTSYQYYRTYVTATTTAGSRASTYGITLYEKNYTILTGSAGGGFVLSGSYNLNLTDPASGIDAGTTNCLTFSGSAGISTSVTSSNITSNTTAAAVALVHSGSGTINYSGSITRLASSAIQDSTLIRIVGPGTLNINGSINAPTSNVVNVNVLSINNASAVVNIIGNIAASGTQKQTISLTNGTLNIIGNVVIQTTTENSINGVNTTAGTLNITGNLTMDNIQGGANLVSYCVSNGSLCTFNLTGNIVGDTSLSSTRQSYVCVNSGKFNHVGSIQAGRLYPAMTSATSTAINILTGPFISSTYGIVPFQVSRMHLKPTANSYFEFRDNSTNGALSPGAIASASYLYSPATVVSAPSQNDVRFGVVFASGSQTGQMKVPTSNQVRIGIAVDNTTGSAVLTATDVANAVWNRLTTELTASNSIGARLKNVSTPAITGAQLTALG